MSTRKRAPLLVRRNHAFFWKQWPSNWEASPFVICGDRYCCVEQWMMAEKARLFQDVESLQAIMATTSPAKQKELGRQIQGYDDARWAEVRYDVVLQGTLAKYQQNLELLQLLLDTDDLILVEASPYDRIWGIGMGVKDPELLDQSKWGLNLLGRAITNSRDLIKFGGPPPT